MKLPIDIASGPSAELVVIIEQMVNDPEREEPPTLAEVRAVIWDRMSAADRRDERLHPQLNASLLDEVDALIDEFGGDALALDFVAVKASEPLSRIIEIAMGDPLVRHEPTLGRVRDAMSAGLTAKLVGDGIIEADEDQTLLAEIEGLIDRHGQDAVAEAFIRFE